jgi:hypothetical protein
MSEIITASHSATTELSSKISLVAWLCQLFHQKGHPLWLRIQTVNKGAQETYTNCATQPARPCYDHLLQF